MRSNPRMIRRIPPHQRHSRPHNPHSGNRRHIGNHGNPDSLCSRGNRRIRARPAARGYRRFPYRRDGRWRG